MTLTVFHLLPVEMATECRAILQEIAKLTPLHPYLMEHDTGLQTVAALLWCVRELGKLRDENERLRAEMQQARQGLPPPPGGVR